MKKILALVFTMIFILGTFSVTIFATPNSEIVESNGAAGSHVHSYSNGVIENEIKKANITIAETVVYETLDLNVSTSVNSQGQIVVTVATPTTLSTSLRAAEGVIEIGYVPSFMTFNGVSGSFLGKVIDSSNYTSTSGKVELYLEPQSVNLYTLSTRLTFIFDPVGGYTPQSRSSLSVSGQATTLISGGGSTIYLMHVNREFAYCSHAQTKDVVSIPATCSKEGLSTTICQVCGLAIKETYIPKTDHTYPDVPARVITAATCTTSGLGEFVCKICHQTGNSVIPAKGHTYGTPYLGTDGRYYVRCSVCGVINLSEKQCAHDDSYFVYVRTLREATCTTVGSAEYKCSVDGTTITKEVPLKSHTWQTINIINAATETQSGLKEERCTVCGLTEYHEYKYHVVHEYKGREEIITPATCTTAGSKKVFCTGCDNFITETIPATGHKFTDWTIVQAGSCTQNLVRERTCNICGLEETETVEAIGHVWLDWTVEKESTCTSAGSKYRICEVCGERQVNEIPKLEHSFRESDYVVIKNPTCVSEGISQCLCSVCREAVNQKSIPIEPNNHDFAEWVTEIKADCLNSGLSTRTCKLCGKVETNVVPSAGHVFAGEISLNGVSTKTCSVCNAVQTVVTKNNAITKKSVTSSNITLTFNQGLGLTSDVFFYVSQIEGNTYQSTIQPYATALEAKKQTIISAYTATLKINNEAKALTSANVFEYAVPSDLEGVDVRVWYLKSDGALVPIDAKAMKRTKTLLTIEIKEGAFDNASGVLIFTNAGKRSNGAAIPITIAGVTVVVIAGLVIFLRSRDSKHKVDPNDDDDFYTDTEISTKKTKKAVSMDDDE